MMLHIETSVFRFVLAGALLLLLTSAMNSSLAQDRQTSDRDGRALYIDYGCSGCHGYEAQGTVASPPVPRLAPTAYPYEAFAVFVRTPPRIMPAYSPTVMSDAQLRAIYDFVTSIAEPPAAADIPTLQDLL